LPTVQDQILLSVRNAFQNASVVVSDRSAKNHNNTGDRPVETTVVVFDNKTYTTREEAEAQAKTVCKEK
jgi:hypothetical protein